MLGITREHEQQFRNVEVELTKQGYICFVPAVYKLVTKVFNSYDSFNVFINRVKPYNASGRFQTEQESDELSKKLLEFITTHGISCRHYNGDMKSYYNT